MSLVPDVLRLVYALIKHDFPTTVAWFWTCKTFAAMVSAEDKTWHTQPHVTSRNGLSQYGPLSRLATFQSKPGVLWCTTPSITRLPRSDWTREIWDLILYKGNEDDPKARMETEEYEITQGWVYYETRPWERYEWIVCYKSVYTFYEGCTNVWNKEARSGCHKVGPFIRDTIDWGT